MRPATRTALVGLLLGLIVAAPILLGKSYQISIGEATSAGDYTLQPGRYELVVEGDRVQFLRNGRVIFERTVRVETVEKPYSQTVVIYSHEGNTRKIREIRLGGTTWKLIFD